MADDARDGTTSPMIGRSALGRARWSVWLLAAAVGLLPWLLHVAASDEPVLWWASRAYGFVAYLALWFAMLTGVLTSAKGLHGWLGRKTLMELHEQTTLIGLFATGVHLLAVVTNEHAGIGPAAALLPFASPQLTAEVAVGTLAFWALLLVWASSAIRARLPYATWRTLHALALGAFLLAFAHSIAAGTDSVAAGPRWLYVTTGAILIGAVITRVLIAFGLRRRHRPGGASW